MNKPVKEFLSVVLDATIIKPLIESVTGEDMITGEDLSEFEKGMKLASGVVSLFTLGQGGVIINGGRVAFQSTLVTMGKMVAIDMVTTGVTYGTSELCQKMGMPGSVTMLLSMLAGGKVGSTLNNKWLANLSAEDAARFWKNLEPGEKLPPGMTGDEYAKHLKGLGRVDDAAALGKVDYDEVLKLRKEGERVGRAKTPEQIIKDRTKNLDLNPHPVTQKQLSSKKMAELKKKMDNRTITKAEYEQYNWNKKITKIRQTAVDDFWDDEIIRITENKPSRNWSQRQIDDIMAGGKPKYNGETLQGHHSYSVSQYPHLAGRSEVIWPVTPNEHFRGWHGGNWKNSLPGKPIIDIKDF